MLLFAVVRAFDSNAASRSLSFLVLSFSYGIAHVMAQPFRLSLVNSVQTVLLCLLFLACVSNVTDDMAVSMAVSVSQQQRAPALSWMFGVTVLAPMCAIGVGAVAWLYKQWSNHKHRLLKSQDDVAPDAEPWPVSFRTLPQHRGSVYSNSANTDAGVLAASVTSSEDSEALLNGNPHPAYGSHPSGPTPPTAHSPGDRSVA